MKHFFSLAAVWAITAACSAYSVNSIRSVDFNGGAAYRRVSIGFFEVTGNANISRTQRNLYDALAFSLQQRGYLVTDFPATQMLMQRLGLPVDRLLLESEVLQFSGNSPARVLLQGRIEEIRTDRLVESHIQSMIQLQLFDVRTGKKVGQIVLFGKDQEFVTGKEIMLMTDHLCAEFDKMIGSVK